MLAIAGAILINAGCVLMASGQDTTAIYVLQRILLMAGGGLMGVDIQFRIGEFVKKARADRKAQM